LRRGMSQLDLELAKYCADVSHCCDIGVKLA
jgi:hypothetical protein